jgi:hypothetical protein
MSEEIETPKEDVKIEEPVVEEPTINPIDEAKNVLEETKKTLASISEERKRIEKATAEMLVNGRSYAGQAPPKEETADEKWAREAKLRYAGTGMDPTI